MPIMAILIGPESVALPGPPGRQHPCAYAQHERDTHGECAELDGDGQLAGDDLVHRPTLIFKGRAQIAFEQVTEIVHVLDGQGLIQPVVGPPVAGA